MKAPPPPFAVAPTAGDGEEVTYQSSAYGDLVPDRASMYALADAAVRIEDEADDGEGREEQEEAEGAAKTLLERAREDLDTGQAAWERRPNALCDGPIGRVRATEGRALAALAPIFGPISTARRLPSIAYVRPTDMAACDPWERPPSPPPPPSSPASPRGPAGTARAARGRRSALTSERAMHWKHAQQALARKRVDLAMPLVPPKR